MSKTIKSTPRDLDDDKVALSPLDQRLRINVGAQTTVLLRKKESVKKRKYEE